MKDLTIVPAVEKDKAVLYQLAQLYQHDMAPFVADHRDNLPGEDGRYDFLPHLWRYWSEEERFPFLVTLRGRPAGFVLVRRLATDLWKMDEFFIVSGCRRRGVGRAVALDILSRFPGTWEISVLKGHQPAHAFWRSLLPEVRVERRTDTDHEVFIVTPSPQVQSE